jgi:hypothetical protein
LFKAIGRNEEMEDREFDMMFPKAIQAESEFHFTPIKIAKLAAEYLADSKETKILDIGSGAGKFCMIGSVCTDAFFVGVEQRIHLNSLATQISRKYELTNLQFIHANITAISFTDFHAFYFFNSFHEQINISGRMDDSQAWSKKLYEEYSLYVKTELDKMPAGTKLVTYFSYLDEVPDTYELQYSYEDSKLKMWRKKS